MLFILIVAFLLALLGRLVLQHKRGKHHLQPTIVDKQFARVGALCEGKIERAQGRAAGYIRLTNQGAQQWQPVGTRKPASTMQALQTRHSRWYDRDSQPLPDSSRICMWGTKINNYFLKKIIEERQET